MIKVNINNIKERLLAGTMNYDNIIEAMEGLVSTANQVYTDMEEEIIAFSKKYNEINPDLVRDVVSELDKQLEEINSEMDNVKRDITYLTELKENDNSSDLEEVANRLDEMFKAFNDNVAKYTEVVRNEVPSDVKQQLYGNYDE